MRLSASFRLPSAVSLRPSSQPPASAALEHPSVVALRKRLVVCALERPPRFRTDFDVLLIVRFLASFDAFAGVALPALHYLATEATLLTLRDGDILCYQEDPVTEDSSAFVIMDGSLCGYFNKAFGQRPNAHESFQAWNARQVKLHGVLIDFGEFQTTYSSGALCGFDDLLQSGGRLSQGPHSSAERLCRRKGIHAQELTRAIAIRMDTLERIRHRFSLSYEKGTLWAVDASQSDLAYLGICAQLSESAKTKLLQTAPRRQLVSGEELAPPYGAALTPPQSIDALIVVLSGRLDVFWDGDDDDPIIEFAPPAVDDSSSQRSTDRADATAAATALEAAEKMRAEELTRLRNTALAKIRRGQTFGDQMLGLGLDKVYTGAQLASTSLPIRLTSGGAGTEVIWISRELFEETLREDRVRLSYHPVSSASASTARLTANFRDWASAFFESTNAVERGPSDFSDLARRMLADRKLSKLMFQFPPLVLERVCHAMELRHFSANGLFLGSGDEITHASVVVHGALRVLAPAASPASPAASSTQSQELVEQFLPGDVFGAVDLAGNEPTSASAVYVEADTAVLTIPRVVFDRWLAPLFVDTIFAAGTAFHRLETFDPAASMRQSGEKRSKLAGSPTRPQSIVTQQGSQGLLTDESESFVVPVLEDATKLLKRMGVFSLLPRFVLREVLARVSVVHKAAGDVLFHESEEAQVLVVLLSGFLSFYSLEHMSTTLEMFHKHSFCHFSSFQGSQTNPEDFVAEGDADDTASRSATIAKHRAAMHGVHIQTLHPGNAFRTGVLANATICPATVVAQTDCECLVLDESAYAQLLKHHRAVIDVSELGTIPSHAPVDAATALDGDADSDHELFPPGSLRSIISQRNPSTLHPALVRCLEQMRLPWLTQSALQMQQLLRSMRCVHVKPGERLIRCNDVLDHLIIVLSGRLALFVRQNEDVSAFLDASQRSVRSLMLERSVTSNYSTTSQQLYKEAHASAATSSARASIHGRLSSSHSAKRKMIRNKISRISGAGLFVDSVLAAVREERLQKVGAGAAAGSEPSSLAVVDSAASLPKSEAQPTPPTTRGQRASLLLHSAAAKAKIQQKIEAQRVTGAPAGAGHDAAVDSLFLCTLGPGEIYGDEVLAPHGIFRSVHDVFVEVASTASGSSATLPASPLSGATGAQLVLLDRHAFHSIVAKTDDEIETELRVRSKLAKQKWQRAERKVARRISQAAVGGAGDGAKTSKLFDLFRNILNQRCLLTMRTIAEIPVLRELPDACKRELCMSARFEALERGLNAYRENGAQHSGSEPRYYVLLNGRVALTAKNSSAAGSTGAGSGAAGVDNYLRDVLPGEGFGEFEILVPEFARSILAVALEPSRLLSFPASVFLNHWPHLAAIRSSIAYLRTRVPFFARLELDRIAYLFTTLSFETVTRGSNIFEQAQPLSTPASSGELYMIKEGECAIRQRVVLDIQEPDEKPAPGDAVATGASSIARRIKHHAAAGATKSVERATMRVMVAVADVSAGHVFWFDGDAIPYTLQAVSASVTISRIAIDKLRAILPRTQLAALEKAKNRMRALYTEQFEMAKRAVVTLLNEKRAAQMGVLPNPTFLPAVNLQSPFKVVPRAPPSASGAASDGTAGFSKPAIPFSRLLMSRPVDLVDLLRAEQLEEQTADNSIRSSSSVHGYARAWRGGEGDVDAAYRQQHEVEHYALEHGLPNSTLVGSFPDSVALRRRRRSDPRTKSIEPRTTAVHDTPTAAVALKADESMQPEPVTHQHEFAAENQLSDTTSHLRFEVKVPPVHDDPHRSRRAPTPPSTSRPGSRGLIATAIASLARPKSRPYTPPAFRAVERSGVSEFDVEIDLREFLRAQMTAVDAPMRTLKLEPLLSKANALGQYLVLSPSARRAPSASIQQDSPSRQPPEVASPRPKSFVPFRVLSRLRKSGRATKPTPLAPITSVQPSHNQLSEQAPVRKQGFLYAAVLTGPSDAALLSQLPRGRRRRYFALVDSVLCEHSDDVDMALVRARVTPPSRTYLLGEQAAGSSVADAPVTSAPESERAALRLSFALIVGSRTQLLLTAESATEKKIWMHELQLACALGPRVAPLHQRVRATHAVAPALVPGAEATTAAPQPSRGGRQRSSVDADLVLEVEYRIS